MGKTLSGVFADVWTGERWALWPYAAGIAGYLLIERLAFIPLKLYVFGHEATHALSCMLSGGRVFDFHASSRGGHVKLSKTNSWIALSPYCVPLYTIFILLVFRVLGVRWNLTPYTPVLQVLVGATLAFHFSLTVFALKTRQPDLEVLGWLPSLGVILFANGACLAALLVFLFPRALGAAELAQVFGANFKGTVFQAAWGAGRLWHFARPG
jgi:hypothetical protein